MTWRSEGHTRRNGPCWRAAVQDVNGGELCGDGVHLHDREGGGPHTLNHRTTAAGGCHAEEPQGVGRRRRGASTVLVER